jgi:hypothetical protein
LHSLVHANRVTEAGDLAELRINFIECIHCVQSGGDVSKEQDCTLIDVLRSLNLPSIVQPNKYYPKWRVYRVYQIHILCVFIKYTSGSTFNRPVCTMALQLGTFRKGT